MLGLSPPTYTSTTAAEHEIKNGEHYDKIYRLKQLNKNYKSNFISKEGFEKIIEDSRPLGPHPHKGEPDQAIAEKIKAELKRSNILLGKDSSTFSSFRQN